MAFKPIKRAQCTSEKLPQFKRFCDYKHIREGRVYYQKYQKKLTLLPVYCWLSSVALSIDGSWFRKLITVTRILAMWQILVEPDQMMALVQ